MTYLSDILEVLTNEPTTIETIIKEIGAPKTKLVYVIDAIKKGISKELIRIHRNPDEKRKYKGHCYSLA